MNEIEILKKRADKLTSLIQISTIINSHLDMQEVMRLVMEKAQEVMKAEASSVFLLNHKTNLLEIQSALGHEGDTIVDTTEELREKITLEMGQGIAGWVAQNEQPLNVADTKNDPRFFSDADKKTGFQTKSLLAAPLKVKDKLIGVAEVINPIDGQPFDEEDIQLFSTFCSSVAMAIENARLHREMIEKERFNQQLQSAKIIQQSFLPKSFPKCPLNRFEIFGTYQPAKTIGGDFYDFLVLDDDHLGIAFGDVSGKGIPAALFMARLLSDFHLYINSSTSLEQTISKLNDVLVDRSQRGMFVTFIGSIFNIALGELIFTNAGHLPLLHIHAKNKEVEKISLATSIPLGIKTGIEYSQQKLKMDTGDYVIFFTDGVIEARDTNNKEIGLTGFIDYLKKEWQSPEQLIQKINQEILDFRETADQHDDLTLVALKKC